MSIDTANMLNTYNTEQDALQAVRSAVSEYGPECAGQWALMEVTESGDILPLIMGDELVERARGTAPA